MYSLFQLRPRTLFFFSFLFCFLPILFTLDIDPMRSGLLVKFLAAALLVPLVSGTTCNQTYTWYLDWVRSQ